ncbi:MAG: hypothetical protein Q7U72_16580 [Brevundimonas sp.]|nr:hypothetical protein [Brevundimonas sp.]MDO9079050.1 hypothetical protein [Brevundimonas sp.]MDP3080835.1 hypothetical protein [Brevundimonas sp.]MDZ4062384.1 hypothetical protein [Brevundimonas sp.]
MKNPLPLKTWGLIAIGLLLLLVLPPLLYVGVLAYACYSGGGCV